MNVSTLNLRGCVTCGRRVDRFQRSYGAAIAYPCEHWHTEDQARAIVAGVRAHATAAALPDAVVAGSEAA